MRRRYSNPRRYPTGGGQGAALHAGTPRDSGARMTDTLSPGRPGIWRTRARQVLTAPSASIITSVVVVNVLRIFSSIALTRLLDSSAYGVVGIVTSIAYVIAMLSDAGIFPFVIRHKDAADQRFLDEVWTIRLVRGALLTIVMIALAAPIARFLGKEALTAVIMVWSFSFLLDGLSSLAAATGIRDQQLWRLSIIDMATSIMAMALSVASAIVLHSYWAMLIGMLGSHAGRGVLTYALFARSGRRLRFSAARSREIWAFSRNIALSSGLSLFILQADKVMLARMMPLAAFGFYAIATTLAAAPEAIANPYAARVLYPAYVKAAEAGTAALRRTFYAVRRHLSLLYALAVGGLIGGAPILVGLLYDPRYLAVGPLLQIVAIRVLLRMPNLAAYQATIALGDTRAGLIGNVCRTGWLVVVGAIAVVRNDAWLMIVAVATDEIPATLWYWWALWRKALLDIREELLFFVTAAAGAGLGTLCLVIWHDWLRF